MPPPPNAHLSLGVWRPGAGEVTTEFVGVRSVTPEIWERFHVAASAYTRMTERRTYSLVRRNYHRLTQIVRFYERLEVVGGRFRHLDQRSIPFYLMADVVNLLTSMRLYLESERDRLVGEYGKGSVQLGRYTKATQFAFDSYPGYRLTYNLRDFAQHCGAPIASVNIRASKEGTREVAVILSRDDLLGARFHWSRGAKDVLVSLPARFSLMPLIDEAMDGIAHIEEALLGIDLDKLLMQRSVLTDALDLLGEVDGHPILIAFPDAEADGELSWVPLPDRAQVGHIDELAESPDPLAAAREPQQRPSDFALTEEQRRVNSLAFALLSHMVGGHESRSMSASLATAVEGLTATAPIEDLVAGLANVSLYLAHLAAQAIGADVRELVAGME